MQGSGLVPAQADAAQRGQASTQATTGAPQSLPLPSTVTISSEPVSVATEQDTKAQTLTVSVSTKSDDAPPPPSFSTLSLSTESTEKKGVRKADEVKIERVSEDKRKELEKRFNTTPAFCPLIRKPTRSQRTADYGWKFGFGKTGFDKLERIKPGERTGKMSQKYVDLLRKKKNIGRSGEALPDDEDQRVYVQKTHVREDPTKPIQHIKEVIWQGKSLLFCKALDRHQIRCEVYRKDANTLWFTSEYTNDGRMPDRSKFVSRQMKEKKTSKIIEERMADDILAGKCVNYGKMDRRDVYLMEIDGKGGNARRFFIEEKSGTWRLIPFDRGCTWREGDDYNFPRRKGVPGTEFVPDFKINAKNLAKFVKHPRYNKFGFWFGGESLNPDYQKKFAESKELAFQCFSADLEHILFPPELWADIHLHLLAQAAGDDAVAYVLERLVKSKKEVQGSDISIGCRLFILEQFKLSCDRRNDYFEAAKELEQAGLHFGKDYLLTKRAEDDFEEMLLNIQDLELVYGQKWVKVSGYNVNTLRENFAVLRQIFASLPEKKPAEQAASTQVDEEKEKEKEKDKDSRQEEKSKPPAKQASSTVAPLKTLMGRPGQILGTNHPGTESVAQPRPDIAALQQQQSVQAEAQSGHSHATSSHQLDSGASVLLIKEISKLSGSGGSGQSETLKAHTEDSTDQLQLS